ncbi:hypothetical protein AAG906_000516 [Vitis piasezkii]
MLSTLPCSDVLSGPNASVLDKSLDRVSRAIIIHTTKSMLDGTLLGHFRQPITTQRQRCPHLLGAVRQPEEMKAILNGAKPWKGDNWKASDKCKPCSKKQEDLEKKTRCYGSKFHH